MKIVEKISLDELRQMAEKMYGTLVKADVDVARQNNPSRDVLDENVRVQIVAIVSEVVHE